MACCDEDRVHLLFLFFVVPGKIYREVARHFCPQQRTGAARLWNYAFDEGELAVEGGLADAQRFGVGFGGVPFAGGGEG
ncbi:hypothetical protein CCAX7_55910 [Capsulimonas corticalis]|uniref:Uncharacterized protein n=1 Tax=Capsulimonas corticalis TaxID=2219043 RepID=A0A402D0V0_9BACT|nr:hypothetical protein CCAX7_55910 [Capsulimonas corticalis]